MMPTSIGILRAHSVAERAISSAASGGSPAARCASAMYCERADLLVALAVLGREREAALEQRERGLGVAALHLGLAPRHRGVGGGGQIAGLLGDLERLAEVALGAIDVAEVGVALADVAELERDARAIAERLIDLERALVVRERLLVLAERGEHDAHVVERARLVARHADRAIDDERLGVALDRVPRAGRCSTASCRAGSGSSRARSARASAGGRPSVPPARAVSHERERLLGEPQRLLGVADEPRDRGAQAQRLGLEQRIARRRARTAAPGAAARSAAGALPTSM